MKQVISLVLFGLFCGNAVVTNANVQNTKEGPSHSGRIVNGIPVNISNYKYALSMRLNGEFRCGASIITCSHALSAAHCVYNLTGPRIELTLYGGSTSASSGGVEFPVVGGEIHPYYKPNSKSNTSDYDVAILNVPANSFSGRPNMAPLALQTKELPVGTRCFVVGWGRTGENQPVSTNQLLYANMNIVSQSSCASMWANFEKLCAECKQSITSNMVCAQYYNGMDTCRGDSGGALVCGGRLTGVVSFGPYCTGVWPSVFAKVTAPSMRSFIQLYTGI
ncbi:trypsin beta [Anopheles gambiae]|uniref:trypsin beta n=1 Tax=Anopheles gambiae TaxID=7165 RepID=UPI002AC99628|nr:trypsin beta [Anopheles gambiae]